MPFFPVEIIAKYLGAKPELVVDLGCGTGLSSLIWRGNCSKLIGIEPSDDMRTEAQGKTDNTLSFIKGFGHDTGLPDNCADAVICSQSFHWMEPFSTLGEVNRILKSGGVFAAVDCDWPPVCNWKIEKSYNKLFKTICEKESLFSELSSTFKRFPKDKHLQNINDSGYFSYTREIVFSNREPCGAERLINLTMSQGDLQNILKIHPEFIKDELEQYRQTVFDNCKDSEFTVDFCYRMRIAVK
jgi:ubiquinone/menaquinone biosynthesis C-methylase UbiE